MKFKLRTMERSARTRIARCATCGESTTALGARAIRYRCPCGGLFQVREVAIATTPDRTRRPVAVRRASAATVAAVLPPHLEERARRELERQRLYAAEDAAYYDAPRQPRARAEDWTSSPWLVELIAVGFFEEEERR